MSKRSLFWSTASGKLGDIVLRTVRGVEIASKYQPKVLNPRSMAQMTQRILFADAVKFYRHANDNLFKFAFEDKRKNESDYNAFMRYNAKRGLLIDKDRMDEYNYPAWGTNWMLSRGSLNQAEFTISDVADMPIVLSSPSIGEPETITLGTISTALMNDYGLMTGDYVTIVKISTKYTSYEFVEEYQQPKWFMAQFKIDSTSQVAPDDVNINVAASEGENINIGIKNSENGGSNAYAVIFSRPLKDKTYVSDGVIQGDKNWIYVCGHWEGEGAIEGSLITWGATQEAILKGSIYNNNDDVKRAKNDNQTNKSSSDAPDEEPGGTSSGKKSTKNNK